MFYIYILKSEKDGKLYIGYCNDLNRRYEEHKSGLAKSTKNRRPLDLIYYEAYSNKKLAQERERKLKQFGSAYKELIKRIV